ncbi:hypothetical protein QTH87_05915 [Variovorax sp. J22P168]|uniref:hypothetical protein n=1 Tax=Variovorax jilinensis TaxID=3053513 RepID=UPI00257900D9|nr:hypothetical protein [Variovorax sp. J22P168]MDM0011974.1 hypothetical protein [Variovorax sp. J22P168]
MTRAEAMVKLLAIGELRLEDLYAICGWHPVDVRAVLLDLEQGGQIRCLRLRGERWYQVIDQAGADHCACAMEADRCA